MIITVCDRCGKTLVKGEQESTMVVMTRPHGSLGAHDINRSYTFCSNCTDELLIGLQDCTYDDNLCSEESEDGADDFENGDVEYSL